MKKTRNPDWFLFGYIVVLLILGLAFCYSASSVVGPLKTQHLEHPRSEWYYISRQLLFAAAGVGALIWLSRTNFRTWNTPGWAFVAMGSSIALVVVAGLLDGRAHRWLRLPGGFQIQPSEFAKPALIVFCAYFIAKRMNAINDKHTVLPVSIVVGLLGAAVAWGDLGTAVVLMVASAVLFFVAGLESRYIALALVIAFLGTGVSIATKPYRLARAIAFVDPELKHLEKYAPAMAATYREYLKKGNRDPNYQVKQSLVTVGSGGVSGLGFMESKQKLLFLPESHTDFIYAVVAEEGGLLGALAVMAIYLLIAWRGVRLFFRSDNTFGRYLALGITVLLLFQALVNISVVLGIAPTKGLPLPLISYGGSSMLSTLICFGMLMSVSEHSS